MEMEMNSAAQAVANALSAAGLRLATAESCTGGWIAKQLTDIAGSSGWFECGLVSYSNACKQHLLGVAGATLEREGAVSEAVVRQMVDGALACTDADVALAVSGVAGPGGGTAQKPVGTVWFCWGRRGGASAVRLEQLAGDRDAVRRQAVIIALQGVLAVVD